MMWISFPSHSRALSIVGKQAGQKRTILDRAYHFLLCWINEATASEYGRRKETARNDMLLSASSPKNPNLRQHYFHVTSHSFVLL